MGNVNSHELRTPEEFSSRAQLLCWWWCGNSAHDWFTAKPYELDNALDRCPDCDAERAAARRLLELSPVAQVSALVEGWNDERPYAKLLVRDLRFGHAPTTYDIRCPKGHKVGKSVDAFLERGCQYCRSAQTRAQTVTRRLFEADPELYATLHPTKNGDPHSILENEKKSLWWRSGQCCGLEWQDTISARQLGRRPQAGRGVYYCPQCESQFGSLAWLDPELAAEWHEDNTLTAWHIKPFSVGVTVKWRCAADASHEFTAKVSDRSHGKLCPHCSKSGISKIETDFLRAAREYYPDSFSGRIGSWKLDILIPSLLLVIEYDGEYWHQNKFEVDTRKSLALIEAGYRVARIRENHLALLPIAHDSLYQLNFSRSFGDIPATLQSILTWARNT